MVAARRLSLDNVGDVFADALRDVPVASSAWVSSQHEGYDLWLLVEPIDLGEEQNLCAVVDPLNEHFPSTSFTLHVLNPRTFSKLVPETIVPSRARRVPLHDPA